MNNVAPDRAADNASVTVNEGQTATNSGTYGDVPADTVTLTASIGTLTYGGGTWNWSYNYGRRHGGNDRHHHGVR